MVQATTSYYGVRSELGCGTIPRLVSEIASDVLPTVALTAGTKLTFCCTTRTTWEVFRNDVRCPGCGCFISEHDMVLNHPSMHDQSAIDTVRSARHIKRSLSDQTLANRFSIGLGKRSRVIRSI